MRRIAVTQRVAIIGGERRDCLDQRWHLFLKAAGLFPVLVPNVPEVMDDFCRGVDFDGVLLTGGNTPVSLGGDAPERDEVERLLYGSARKRRLSVMGVCRGMQMLQLWHGAGLVEVRGHVGQQQEIMIEGMPRLVNSFHRFGSHHSVDGLEAWAVARDGVVKGVRSSDGTLMGIMWHPERQSPFSEWDVRLFAEFFRTP